MQFNCSLIYLYILNFGKLVLYKCYVCMWYHPVGCKQLTSEWQSSSFAKRIIVRLVAVFRFFMCCWSEGRSAEWKQIDHSQLAEVFIIIKIKKKNLPPCRLHIWHQSIRWLTTSRCPRLPLATLSSEPLTKSIIPSLHRATANRILHRQRREMGTFWFGNNHKREEVSVASPARTDIDVIDFAGHHGEFCHQLNHMTAVQHHVTLRREAQLQLE